MPKYKLIPKQEEQLFMPLGRRFEPLGARPWDAMSAFDSKQSAPGSMTERAINCRVRTKARQVMVRQKPFSHRLDVDEF